MHRPAPKVHTCTYIPIPSPERCSIRVLWPTHSGGCAARYATIATTVVYIESGQVAY